MKMRPIAEARWSSVRCGDGSRSMRAAISACSVSGIRSASAARPLGEHPHRLLDEERVALGLREHGRDVDRQLELGGQRGDELGALVGPQRLELERRRADAASAPRRPDVEQLGARDAEQEQRRLAHPRGEMLDQLEQRLLAPVHVLEHEHERLRLGELLRPRTRRPCDLLLRALALDRLEHADREPEQIGDRLVLAARAQLLLRLVERVVVGDAGGRLDHLGERPVRDALAVRQAAAGEHGRAFEAVRELAREPALPDARVAVDRDERRAPVTHGARERVLEQLELRLPPDERRRRATHGRAELAGADDALRGDRLAPAAQLERADRLELDAPADEAGGARADENLVRASPPAGGAPRG